MLPLPRRCLTVLAGGALLLGGCGSGGGSGGADLTVVAGFYPLEHAAEQVAADVDGVQVVGLTRAGVDPHDLELAPRQVATIQDAELVFLAGGMQPALDDAVAHHADGHAVDVTEFVDLMSTGPDGHDHAEEGDDGEAEHGEEGHDHDHDHDHDHGGHDPHFWLDPQRYGSAVQAVAEELAVADPDHAAAYRANAEAFTADLAELDSRMEAGLADCRQRTVVTTHTAFGYLTERYGLNQVGITGVTSEAEASPAQLAEVVRVVQDEGVSTVYAEVLRGNQLAEVIAAETGAEVLLLDPLEGITDSSPGTTYIEVMDANLESLQEGLDCS